jgi:uncharacterized protein
MTTDSPLIRALLNPAAYPHPVASVRLIETHISWVLLTGEYVYKIKKPVNFGFLDFSTLALRHGCCREEVHLNRRLASDWYLAVVPVTATRDGYVIGGGGSPVEYAVQMRQFPAAETLKDLAEAKNLYEAMIDQLADQLAVFHDSVERADGESEYGKAGDIKHWCLENFDHIRPLLGNNPPDLSRLDAIAGWTESTWLDLMPLLEQRRQQGFIRECHGDLHLDNMTLIDGKAVIFDCIEFNPKLRWIDTISEIAFLMMDLCHRGYWRYAFRLLNHYLQHNGDFGGVSLLRFYLVYRAMVRAKVTLLHRAQETEEAQNYAEKTVEYQAYIALAERVMQTGGKWIAMTHGFSGSGKSTYASQLAEKAGAILIRSDVERKRLFTSEEGVGLATSRELYSSKATAQTYTHLATQTKALISAGFSVIVDAAFLKYEQRALFRQTAQDCAVEWRIVDVQTPEDVLIDRLRHRKNDASDATVEIMLQQKSTAEALTEEERALTIVVDSQNPHALEQLFTDLDVTWKSLET